MKIFTSLMAILGLAATVPPKTLEAARATLTDARNCLDKIGAMFAAASLDLDALLAKGDHALKDFVTELNNKAAAAEARATEAAAKVTAAETKVTEVEGKVTSLSSQLSALNSLFSSIGFSVSATLDGKPIDVQATALQDAFKIHVSAAVTQKAQEIGIPATKLPKANPSADAAETEADLLAQLATATTAEARGRIGAKLNALRDAAWGKSSGKN